MNNDKITQKDLVKEFFISHPNQDIPHPVVVDWVVSEWKKRSGKVFRDPDRMIRSLAQKGFLIKIAKGVYKYDPNFETNRYLEDLTEDQKKEILKRDGYKCVICGKGVENGVELHVDHIKPKDLGGKATIIHGDRNLQQFCAEVLEVFERNNINGHIEWKK